VKRRWNRLVALELLVAAALSGCATPALRPPQVPQTSAYTATPMPSETVSAAGTGGGAQQFNIGRDISAEWWQLFHSDRLDALIRQAVKESPTLAAAQAALRESQELMRAQVGTLYYPSIDANASAVRRQTTGASFGQPTSPGSLFNLYNASVSVSYTFDFAGGISSEYQALQSQVDYQRFQLEATYLTLTSNIVTTAVKEAGLRAEIRATQEIIDALQQQLDVVEGQFQLGAVPRSDVLVQQVQLAQTRATLPPLEKQLSQTRHQLAVLAGKPPSDATLPEFNLDALQLPQELPVSLPSSLLQQRPDIRGSEALLKQASAQVGVATANLYPQITLTGTYGSETTKYYDLFGSGTSVWSLGAALLQPIFHGGELRAKRRAAVAAYDQAAAQYRQTVLQAFQNVADTLRALETDARALKAQSEAEQAASASLDLARDQFRLGAVGYLSLLIAQRQYYQARVLLVLAQATRYADTAALFQALGGGWWNRAPLADAQATSKKTD
jgi:NodT family efflux transporter outer membrane factor (OMF) lipoprotein